MKYFIECTHTYHTKLNSGIQRVVRNIVRSSATAGINGNVVPVIFENNNFVAIDSDIPYPVAVKEGLRLRAKITAMVKNGLKNAYMGSRSALARLIPFSPFVTFLYAPRTQWGLTRILLLPRSLLKPPRPDQQRPGIHMQPGDVLVLLDSSWHLDLWQAVDQHRQSGAQVVVVLYDLIPHSHPQFCVPPLVQSFNAWMKQAVQRSDAVIAISETIALEFQRELPRLAGPNHDTPSISYFWLGSELDGERAAASALSTIAPEILQVGTSHLPTYVYVSTIEPRKNHRYALQAFENLWERGVAANFVIVGRVGWKMDEFIEDVRSHPQFGKQLFMLNNVEDNELAYLYDNVQGLIFTSVTEGFGLPIVEGLQRGLPVFASDIPVFREIGRQGVRFVDLAAPASLADALANHIAEGAQRLHAPVSWLTWQDSTRQFFTRIEECLAAKSASGVGAATAGSAPQPQ